MDGTGDAPYAMDYSESMALFNNAYNQTSTQSITATEFDTAQELLWAGTNEVRRALAAVGQSISVLVAGSRGVVLRLRTSQIHRLSRVHDVGCSQYSLSHRRSTDSHVGFVVALHEARLEYIQSSVNNSRERSFPFDVLHCSELLTWTICSACSCLNRTSRRRSILAGTTGSCARWTSIRKCCFDR